MEELRLPNQWRWRLLRYANSPYSLSRAALLLHFAPLLLLAAAMLFVIQQQRARDAGNSPDVSRPFFPSAPMCRADSVARGGFAINLGR